MAKIKLSLKPLQEARWEKHEPTGTEFLVAPLPGVLDQEITRDTSDIYGNVDPIAFGHQAAPHVVKGWRGIGMDGAEVPLNEANLKLFVDSHGVTIMPWILRRARSLDHYRVQEIDAAKNA